MGAIDLNMKPELDQFGHPVHYVARTFPGLHIGEYVEVWLRYEKKGDKWDATVYRMKFADGHTREW